MNQAPSKVMFCHFSIFLTRGPHSSFRNYLLSLFIFVPAEFRLIADWHRCHEEELVAVFYCTCIIFHRRIVFNTTHAVLDDHYMMRGQSKVRSFHTLKHFIKTLHLSISSNALQQVLICDPKLPSNLSGFLCPLSSD